MRTMKTTCSLVTAFSILLVGIACTGCMEQIQDLAFGVALLTDPVWR